MHDVIALGELVINFASKSVDAAGYPTMAAKSGGIPSIQDKKIVLKRMKNL